MGMNLMFIEMFHRFPPKGRGASLGYPFIVLGPKGRKRKTKSEHLFNQLGVTVDIFDINRLLDVEHIMDLNKPLDSGLLSQYDFLVNPGAYEHCFDIAQAMMNGHDMLKPGGRSYHVAPIARGKHGYWNFNVDTFRSFYHSNGGRVLSFREANKTLFVVTENNAEGHRASLPYKKRGE